MLRPPPGQHRQRVGRGANHQYSLRVCPVQRQRWGCLGKVPARLPLGNDAILEQRDSLSRDLESQALILEGAHLSEQRRLVRRDRGI